MILCFTVFYSFQFDATSTLLIPLFFCVIWSSDSGNCMSIQCNHNSKNGVRCKNRSKKLFPCCWAHTIYGLQSDTEELNGGNCMSQEPVPRGLVNDPRQKRVGLRVKQSSLPHGGMGLFAWSPGEDIVFRPGDYVCEYTGVLREGGRGDEVDTYYAFHINNRQYIDAANPHTSFISRYINDCRPQDRRDGNCKENNARFSIQPGGRVFVKATKVIRHGEEIFLSYGRAYWADYRPAPDVRAQQPLRNERHRMV